MRTLLLFALFVTASAHAQPVGYWRFEEPDGSKRFASETSQLVGKPDDPVKRSNEVPAQFIYDPLTGKSQPTTASLAFDGKACVRIPLPEEQLGSFTLELFVKPTVPNHAAIVTKRRRSQRAGGFAIQPRYLSQWKQTYYGARILPPNARSVVGHTGHYLSISRIHQKNLDWRHVALVYDAKGNRFTYYTGYYEKVDLDPGKAMTWDGSDLIIGGNGEGTNFQGLIDEVRWTDKALSPTQFLRARDDRIAGVSFASQPTLLPKESGYIDVKEAFGAAGDGETDDTAAFQRAFAELAGKVPLAYHTLYVPPGTYLISDTIRWNRFFVLQGAGRDKTILRLKDKCAGYENADKPKAFVGMGYTPWGEWGRGAGNAIGNYVFDLTIDAGSGNPGVVALDHHSNNHGAVENVTMQSGDGGGHIGLSFVRPWPGPSLIKRVTIRGFDYGVKMASQEYSMTLEDVTLEKQNVAGIHLGANILAMRKIVSRNSVPAIVSEGGKGMITLLDSNFVGGSAKHPAIRAEGALYVRNLTTAGYGSAIEKTSLGATKPGRGEKIEPDTKSTIRGPNVAEFVGDKVVCPRGEATGSLKLAIEETPTIPWGDIEKDWVNVQSFAQHKADDDWTPAIQKAIDSGAKTIYFPREGYPCKGTIHLRGHVERLFGMVGSSLTRPKNHEGDEPILIYDHPDKDKVVAIERLSIAGVTHASPGTLVYRHGVPVPYRNRPGCGKLFVENTEGAGWFFEHPQQAWVRQWNPESHEAGPCIVNRGGSLWALGFKTEYESSKLWAFEGAKTEILGAFIYPIGKIPPDRPIFKNVNSKLGVVYGTSVYQANHKIHILDIDAETTHRIDNAHLKWMGSRARMDLYASHPFEAK